MGQKPGAVMDVIRREELRRSPPWHPGDPPDWAPLVAREWLVTNGLGGYASGTVSGAATRRYHGLLVAAHPAPLGRLLMLADLAESVELERGQSIRLSGEEHPDALELHGARHLIEFRLDWGLPAWRYALGDIVFEKRLAIVHGENTVSLEYRLIEGEEVGFELRPMVDFRSHDAAVSREVNREYTVEDGDGALDISCPGAPRLRLRYDPAVARYEADARTLPEILYRVEASRGYAAVGDLWSPGRLLTRIRPGRSFCLIASTEADGVVPEPDHAALVDGEIERRHRLVALAPLDDALTGELALAADAYVHEPIARVRDVAAARATKGEARSIIAGYHWFTDWGRDTMISLEGLTLCTGRFREARAILRMFAHHVRDGLIPNLFPEGDEKGLYHTADATLWFFHALHRYSEITRDRTLIGELLPKLLEVYEHHMHGTRFGIGVDPADGLLRQGEDGFQLTWMDAKVDNWVVTPRRGKAVEINALWYNALRLLEGWLREAGDARADEVGDAAARAMSSFNTRFWYEAGGHLYDVIDGEAGDDPAFRPNQIFAISLDHPVLDEARWARVVELTEEKLLTPVGLRSLAPGHKDYQPRYFGDLRARDAAYHQGTVWGWLIGPFVDAWLKVHPDEEEKAGAFLAGLIGHLDEACIGQMSEIFDADPPHTPRGCVAQAWTVAEVLRCHVRTQAHRLERRRWAGARSAPSGL